MTSGRACIQRAWAAVGETNDGHLSDIRARPVTAQHVAAAIASATTGPVPVGSVGAGAGTVCFGWKGGIGTSSRRVGAHTIGVFVQTDFGGSLRIDGRPPELLMPQQATTTSDHDGSCTVKALPLDELRRLEPFRTFNF